MTPETFDAIIIGTGQSGRPLAIALGKPAETAVIERRHVGGTCINDGARRPRRWSPPRASRISPAADRTLGRRRRVRVMAEVYRRKQACSSSSATAGSTPWNRALRRADFGEVQLVDARTVRVALKAGGERLLTAPKVVINTGGRPAVPLIPGLGDVRFLDSTSIMDLETLPSHLVVSAADTSGSSSARCSGGSARG